MKITGQRLGAKGKKLVDVRSDVPPHRVRQTILAVVGELYDNAPEIACELRVRLAEE